MVISVSDLTSAITAQFDSPNVSSVLSASVALSVSTSAMNQEMFYRSAVQTRTLRNFSGSHISTETKWNLKWSVQCVKVRCVLIMLAAIDSEASVAVIINA